MSNVKPELSEVSASITSLGSIDSNIELIKDKAAAIKSFYASIVISEEDCKDMKKEMASLNKAKDAVKKYRMDIVKKFNEPLDNFVNSAKETEKILTETYDSLKCQIKKFEDETLNKKTEEVKAYYEEYAQSLHIDFVPFENSGLSVTLSASMKSLKEASKSFLDRIDSDIKLINTLEKDLINEILIEYKKSLNVSNAVITVKERHKALEEEQKKQEALTALKAEETKVEEKVEEVTAPKVVEPVKTYTAKFKVEATIDQIKDLKTFMDLKGIKYDSIK